MMINVYVDSQDKTKIFQGSSRTGDTFGEVKVLRREDFKTIEYDYEHQVILRTLGEVNPNSYNLFCLGPMVSVSNSETIYNTIEVLKEKEFDLFYLYKFLDRCNDYDQIQEIDNHKLARTLTPHGTNCILFSPMGRLKYLSDFPDPIRIDARKLDYYLHKKLRKYLVYTTIPNLVAWDVTQRKNNHEICQSSECREIPETIQPYNSLHKTEGSYNFYYFILALLLVLIFSYIILKITNKSIKM